MKIAVIGCGWLGFPLAQHLILKNHVVLGTTTQEDKLETLKNEGIEALLYDGKNHMLSKNNLEEIQVAVINIPPSALSDYSTQVCSIADLLPINCKIIFTSSTGVYQEMNSTIDETGSVNLDHRVLKAEKLLQGKRKNSLTILRLGGLFGNGRHPIKHLAGRENLSAGLSPINLIHLNDVIAAISIIIDERMYPGIFNLVHPEHPSRQVYYTLMAQKLNLPAPLFSNDKTIGKIIDGSLITRELNFTYDFSPYTL